MRGHVTWIGSLPVRGDIDAADGMHDARNAACEGILNGNEGEEMLAKVEVLVMGNSSCRIDGAVGGERRIGMVVGAGARGEVWDMSVQVSPDSARKTVGAESKAVSSHRG